MVTIETIPNPNMTGQFYEDYANQNFTLKDGQYSPDKRHYCRYAGYGVVKTATILGTKVLYMKPAPPPTATSTRACSVVFPQLFKNFEWEVKMATLSQTSPAKNNWEVAWLFFRQSDRSHHYAFHIQKSGGLQLSKKDYDVWEEREVFLKTLPKDTVPFSFNKWYNVKLRVEGNRIRVSVNGTQYIDITDDGTIGNFGKLPDGSPRPRIPPSPQISRGFCGYYCEDSEVAYDRCRITPLP